MVNHERLADAYLAEVADPDLDFEPDKCMADDNAMGTHSNTNEKKKQQEGQEAGKPRYRKLCRGNKEPQAAPREISKVIRYCKAIKKNSPKYHRAGTTQRTNQPRFSCNASGLWSASGHWRAYCECMFWPSRAYYEHLSAKLARE